MREQLAAVWRLLGTEHGWSRVWVSLGMAITMAGGGLIYYTTQETAPPAGTAHFWIDTTGGTCVRQNPADEYDNDGTECDSLNEAYQAAELGDLVYVMGGTYPAQVIDDEASKDSTGDLADVVIAEASGQTAVLTHLCITGCDSGSIGSTNSPDHLTIRGFSDNSLTSGDCDWNIWGFDLHDVTLDEVTTCNFTINLQLCPPPPNGGCIPDVAEGPLTIQNSTLGNCTTSSGYLCGNNKVDGADNFTFQDNYIHDYHIGDVDDHFECLFISDTHSTVIQRNTFEDCAIFDIFFQHCGTGNGGRCELENITIQNNFFDRPWGGEPSDPSQEIRDTAIEFGTSGAITNVLIRYNSFSDGSNVVENPGGAFTNIDIIGNIFEGGSCIAQATYDYNIFMGGSTCGTNASSQAAADMYTNSAYIGAGGNYHLKSGANPAVSYVTPNTGDYAITDDIDGDTRTDDRDAGGDER